MGAKGSGSFSAGSATSSPRCSPRRLRTPPDHGQARRGESPRELLPTNRDPMTAPRPSVSLPCVRLQCARCHNHPFDVWTQDDYYGLAAYFGNVAHKEVNNVRRHAGHARNQRRRDHLSVGPARDGPAPYRLMMEPKPRGPSPIERATSTHATTWPIGSPQQSPVRPEHGQSDLVPPHGPWRGRSGGRLRDSNPPSNRRCSSI